MLHRLRARVHALAVLLHRKVRLCLAQVGADELRIALDRLVAVGHRSRESHQLDQRGGAVGEAPWVVGRALRHLRVRLHRARPVGFFELLVAELARLVRFLRADVRLLFGCNLRFLGGAELVKDIGGAVFGERFLVVRDGEREIAELLVGCAYPAECPIDVLVGSGVVLDTLLRKHTLR